MAQTPAPPQTYPDWAKVDKDVPYSQFKETVLDIAQPAETSKAKRPGAIIVHGGGWTGGRKESRIRQMCVPFLEKGFVVVNVEYRLAGAALAPAAVTDVLKAAEWFVKNAARYNVDTRRIVTMGDSAGGHLALMIAMTPKSARLGPQTRIAAVFNFYGITDVGELLSPPTSRNWAVEWLPETTPDRLKVARQVSPITYVRRGLPPILTFHGDDDTVVPFSQGVTLTEALQKAGVDAKMVTLPKTGHSFMNQAPAEVWPQVWDFLRSRGIMQ